MLVLLGSLLRMAGVLHMWPTEFVDKFREAERQAATLDVLRHPELVAVLDAIAAAGLRVLTFKGAALAYTHYPAPYVRERTDTDLLVAFPDVPALDRCLARFGYVRQAETSGDLVTYQRHYTKRDARGVAHALDVHWRISDRQALATRFGFDELWEKRVPVRALGPEAMTVGDVHALLLALVHRAGHHPASRNLLWLFDLRLLANGLQPADIRQITDLAHARGLAAIAREGLACAREYFGPEGFDRILVELGGRPRAAPEAIVLVGPSSYVGVLRSDLAALPDWRTRRKFVREHLLPPANYMYARYGFDSPVMLPLLYAWRVLCGAPKWLKSGTTLAPD